MKAKLCMTYLFLTSWSVVLPTQSEEKKLLWGPLLELPPASTLATILTVPTGMAGLPCVSWNGNETGPVKMKKEEQLLLQ